VEFEAQLAMSEIVSPSLLKNVYLDKKVPPEFDLGMDDFVDDDTFEPPRSKRRLQGKENDNAFQPPRLKLHLQGKKNASILNESKCYEDAFNVSKQEFCKMSKPFVIKNTQKNNNWHTIANFQSWVCSRNDHFPEA